MQKWFTIAGIGKIHHLPSCSLCVSTTHKLCVLPAFCGDKICDTQLIEFRLRRPPVRERAPPPLSLSLSLSLSQSLTPPLSDGFKWEMSITFDIFTFPPASKLSRKGQTDLQHFHKKFFSSEARKKPPSSSSSSSFKINVKRIYL